jgi:hypothetical protein
MKGGNFMKRVFIFLSIVLMTGMIFAAGPYSITVGSGDGSLAFTMLYSAGYNDGDDGTFNPGGGIAAGSTVWNNCWCFSSNGTLLGWADKDFTAHTSQLGDGAIAPASPTGNFTNTGITFPGSGSITADLAVNFSAPTPGNTAQVEYVWTMKNSGGSSAPVTILWFLDVDCYIGGEAYTDMAALSKTVTGYTVKNSLGIIAQGNPDASNNVDLNEGVLMDCDVTPSALFGISDTLGSSYYWSNSSSFAGNGPEGASFQIKPEFKDTVQNDADVNYLADSAQDTGGCMQVDVNVPAGGQSTVKFYGIWGIDAVVGGGNFAPTAVSDWALY